MPVICNLPRGLSSINTRGLNPNMYLEGVKRFAWAQDGEQLALPCHDGTIHVWYVKNDTSRLLKGHTSIASSVAWHPGGRKLASASDDLTVRIWDVMTGNEDRPPLLGHDRYITSVAWSAKQQLASCSDDGTVRLWEWEASGDHKTVISHRDRVLAISWSPGGDVLASASWDQQVGFWDSRTGEVQKKRGHDARVFSVAWSPAGSLIASGDQAGNVVLWDNNGRIVDRFHAHDSAILSLSFSSDSRHLASRDQQIAKIWRFSEAVTTPHEIAAVVCRGTPPYATVAFSPRSQSDRLAFSIGESDEEVLVLEAEYMAMLDRRVFIVHGRDPDAFNALKAFLLENGLTPVSLQEQPDNRLSFVMAKFEQYSDVAFAVVLLTPDDVGSLASEKVDISDRARQNVILELGYFIGRLGYEKVCLIQKGQVEFPSDLSGVLYLQMDASSTWKATLRERLQRSGLVLGKDIRMDTRTFAAFNS